jgi:hypothetical protein
VLQAQKLAPALAHYPWLAIHTFEDEWFAARLVLHANIRPVLWQRARCGVFVAVHGEFYPNDQRIQNADEATAALAEAARAERFAALRNGNGLYNLVVYDQAQCRVIVANDATGALLLFRRETEDGWTWSSEPGVLGNGPVDEEGLAALVSIGYQPDHRTAIRGVETMPPAATETYERRNGRIVVRSDSEVTSQGGADRGFASHYPECLRQAVRLRASTGEPAVLPLSGGMDSRLLLGLAREAKLPIRTFGLDAAAVRDASIAARVAERAHVPFELETPPPGMVTKHLALLRSALFTTCDWHPALYLPVCGLGREGSNLWLGIFGGTFGGAQVHPTGARAGLAAFRSNALDPYLGTAIREPAWTGAIPRAVDGAVHELLLNLYARQRRYTSYMVRLAWNFGRPVCPFADRRLLHLALAASREELAGQDLRRRTVALMFPDLAEIPNANDGLPLGSTFRRAFRNTLRRSGIGKIVRRRWPGAYRRFDYSRMSAVAQELWSLLPAGCRERAPAELSPMARLALGPVLLVAGTAADRALDLVRKVVLNDAGRDSAIRQ